MKLYRVTLFILVCLSFLSCEKGHQKFIGKWKSEKSNMYLVIRENGKQLLVVTDFEGELRYFPAEYSSADDFVVITLENNEKRNLIFLKGQNKIVLMPNIVFRKSK